MSGERKGREWMDDDERTPPTRPPSVDTARLWADDCEGDAKRLDRIEIQAREIARQMRALAEMFRAWELSTPDPELRSRAYARLFDLRQRMKDLCTP